MFGHRLGFVLIPIVVFLGFANFFAYRYIQTRKASSFIQKLAANSLEPPGKAIAGRITLKNGIVLLKTRESGNYRAASVNDSVLQGESIATQLGSVTVSFDEIGTVFIGNNAELAAVNLIPTENAFLQKNGSIQYESKFTYPLSIRALHTLSEISGDATINILESTITLRITRGTAKLALIDTNNNTKIWTLKQNQQAIVDDELRRVTVR